MVNLVKQTPIYFFVVIFSEVFKQLIHSDGVLKTRYGLWVANSFIEENNRGVIEAATGKENGNFMNATAGSAFIGTENKIFTLKIDVSLSFGIEFYRVEVFVNVLASCFVLSISLYNIDIEQTIYVQ